MQKWKCLRCGRDKFTQPIGHKCARGQYHKGGIWRKIEDKKLVVCEQPPQKDLVVK